MLQNGQNDVFNRDLLLITSLRFLENQFGKGAVESFVEWKNEKTKREWSEKSKTAGRSDPEYLFRLFNENVHDYDVIEKNSKKLEVKVYQCKHAEVFRTFNAEEMGKRIICMVDHAIVEGFNSEIQFRRPSMLMDGDDCCHFVFELES